MQTARVRLVLLHAALVQRLSLPQKHLVLGLKVLA